MKIDGRKIAEQTLCDLKKKSNFGKYLGILTLSEDENSATFTRQQEKIARELSLTTFVFRRIEEIEFLCTLPAVGGINVNLPLPPEYERDRVIELIDPMKDVNCLNKWNNFVLPPSVLALEKILASVNYQIPDKKVVIIGAGFLIGGPIALYLKNKVKNLEIFRSKNNLCDFREAQALKDADLVILGTGKKNLIKPAMLKDGAGVIDFGNGDLDISNIAELGRLSFYTPAIGGTGPVLVASLFENFCYLTKLQVKIQ